MTKSRAVSRRSAVAGLALTGAGAAIAPAAAPVAVSQDVPADAHPLVGSWLLTVTFDLGLTVAATGIAGADGSLLLVFPPVEVGPEGQIRLRGPAVGAWEAVDERTGRYSVVHVLSDINGGYLGTMTLDGESVVSDDGMTLVDTDARRTLTLRDPVNAVTAQTPGASVVSLTGRRIVTGNAGFANPIGEGTPVG